MEAESVERPSGPKLRVTTRKHSQHQLSSRGRFLRGTDILPPFSFYPVMSSDCLSTGHYPHIAHKGQLPRPRAECRMDLGGQTESIQHTGIKWENVLGTYSSDDIATVVVWMLRVYYVLGIKVFLYGIVWCSQQSYEMGTIIFISKVKKWDLQRWYHLAKVISTEAGIRTKSVGPQVLHSLSLLYHKVYVRFE